MEGLLEKAVAEQSPVGARIAGTESLYRIGPGDKSAAVGSILFSAANPEMPGFLKEEHPKFGKVWRQISSAEIQHRRTTTLWK